MDKQKPAWPDRALILVGHGSSRNPDSARPTLSCADAVRKKGLFGEVHAAFVKQDPYLRDIIARVIAPEVCIVPVMTCKGYITSERIPRQIKEGATSGQHIVQCEPVGTDPRIAHNMIRRINRVLTAHALNRDDTAVLLVGHGSERSRQSFAETHILAERLTAGGVEVDVHPAFLEEPPRVGDWKKLARTKNIIVAPFLISAGLHGAQDIPALLGIAPDAAGLTQRTAALKAAGPLAVGDRKMWLLPAIGEDPAILDIIIERAEKMIAAG